MADGINFHGPTDCPLCVLVKILSNSQINTLHHYQSLPVPQSLFSTSVDVIRDKCIKYLHSRNYFLRKFNRAGASNEYSCKIDEEEMTWGGWEEKEDFK